jgi:hypothetical protein
MKSLLSQILSSAVVIAVSVLVTRVIFKSWKAE